ncbi:ribonuclease inhibitor [Microbacterium sp. HMH0099]|uniref:ribonuclease inhibitor n=1 Tax=Microbacterium sp. HMH0099 TaxID=3414026 RepID=UPI003BF73D0E
MTVATLRIEGARISGIPSLYGELNRVFMPDEDWTLGESLDALDDLLYGGFGVLDGAAPVRVVWADYAVSAEALGTAATRAWYAAKLARPEVYAAGQARRALDALEAGTGETYVDLVRQVFAGHPNIDLVLE